MTCALSYEEANRLCEEYQFLIGTNTNSEEIVVESVVVSPFDPSNKYRFFLFYLLLNNPKLALEYEYSGNDYDVLIIGKTKVGEMLHQSLDIWLKEGSAFSMTSKGFLAQNYSGALYI